MRSNIYTYLLIILFLNCSHFLFGQDKVFDSLMLELNMEQSDTAKIRTLLVFANKYATNDKKNALKYISQAKKIAGNKRNKKENADILLIEAKVFRLSSDLPKAMENLEESITIY